MDIRRVLAIAGVLFMSSACFADEFHKWNFDLTGDLLGWTVTGVKRPIVMGGALWIHLDPELPKPVLPRAISNLPILRPSDPGGITIASPLGLAILTPGPTQLHLTVINLSPVTDVYVRWRTSRQGSDAWNVRRCGLTGDLKKWQEVICEVDTKTHDVVDQIAITVPPEYMRGDIWVKSIELEKRTAHVTFSRPNIAGSEVVPRVDVPGISQAGFAEAFQVLDECVVMDVPLQGFDYPVMRPSGGDNEYGDTWYVMDSSMTLTGAKWTDEAFAENVMRGFRDVQAENPDGRIDAEGDSPLRGQVGDVSQLPIFFEIAFEMAHRTSDPALQRDIYETMRRYLDWWLSPVKRDRRTGLISGIFEEGYSSTYEERAVTFGPQELAPVELNVEVAIGAKQTGELAASLGREDESDRYAKVYSDLVEAINNYLWDDRDGVYYPYNLHTRKSHRRLGAATFTPLRFGIAPRARQNRLLQRLLDPKEFNWKKTPIPLLAMTDPGFDEKHPFAGTPAAGAPSAVWSFVNMTVIDGLEESGYPQLAANLNWKTIKAFHGNYREFLLPSTGAGGGGTRFGWSAAHYIEAVVQHLFGVSVDQLGKELRITPHVPRELYGRHLSLSNLALPSGDAHLVLQVKQDSDMAARIQVNLIGKIPEGTVVITLPTSGQTTRGSTQSEIVATFIR